MGLETYFFLIFLLDILCDFEITNFFNLFSSYIVLMAIDGFGSTDK